VTTTRVELELEGMTCASCVARIERRLNGLEGVEASVNLASEKAAVRFDERVAVEDLIRAVESAGYGAALHRAEGERPADVLTARLLLAAVLTVPVALLAMVPPFQVEGWEWIALALSTPVVLVAGWPFHRAAVKNLRHGAATMDTLVSLGTLAAWAWSVVAVATGAGVELYFEVAAVVTSLVLLGRFIETRARSRSGAALRALLELGAKEAHVLREGVEVAVPAEDVRVGDMFVVRPWQLHAFGDPNVVASHIIWVLFDVGVRRPHEQWYWPDWLAWADQDRRRLTMFLSRNEEPFCRASREVASTFREIDGIVATGDIEGQETRLRLTMSMMLLQFMNQLQSQDPGLDSALTSSKRTVQIFLSRLEHALDEDWTLENMAAECNLSRTQFSQHCLAITNMSPVRYLQSIRLVAAKRKLAAGQGTVTEIAHECGFSSSQYFATCYRRQFGITPIETPRV
jgi:AraC family transcriptional regulator, L-rhamnose operon regulatory protein RhaS